MQFVGVQFRVADGGIATFVNKHSVIGDTNCWLVVWSILVLLWCLIDGEMPSFK